VAPELIQDDFTPERVADETVALFMDSERAETMRRELTEVRSKLGASGASRRAALAVLDVIARRTGTHPHVAAKTTS
jgi:lipid-A-disaccharide synthase